MSWRALRKKWRAFMSRFPSPETTSFIGKTILPSGRRIGELEDLELDDGPSGPVLYDAEFTLFDHTGKKLDSNVQQIPL